MNKKPFIYAVALSLLIVFSAIPSYAAPDTSLIDESSASLAKLGLIQPDKKGSLHLQDKLKRADFIALTVKMLGCDGETDQKDVTLGFKDITQKHWAYNYIKIAVKYGLISGENTSVRPDSIITAVEAETILIRGLGYESSLADKEQDTISGLAEKLGILNGIELVPSKQLTWGYASVLIYNSLMIDFGG